MNSTTYRSDAAWDVIQDIRRISGLNSKKHYLAQHPDISWALLFALNPYKHYGIAPPKNIPVISGEEEFSDATISVLNGLASGEISGYAAKRAVKKTLELLTYKSGMLFLCILNKNLGFGLAAKSINDVFPGLIPSFPIQLAKPIDYNKLRFPVLVSPKLDGLRAVYQNGVIRSRLGNEFKGLTVLTNQLKAMVAEAAGHIGQTPEALSLDGELMIEGEHFNEISGEIRAFAETDRVLFNIFDLPSIQTTQKERILLLQQLSKHFAPKDNGGLLQMVPHWYVTQQEDIEKAYEMAINAGLEGLVVKDPNGTYTDARTSAWQKVKAARTIDLPVVSTFEGRGKYEGLCGGLVVRRDNGVLVRVGSGLTDRQRVAWAEDPEAICGKTIEVAFHEETPDGSLRHPRLKHIRGDK